MLVLAVGAVVVSLWFGGWGVLPAVLSVTCLWMWANWAWLVAWNSQHIEPNKPRWTYTAPPTIQAIVAATAAFIAFVPAYNNFQIAEKKNREDATRAAVERMDKQFTDVQTGLGNGENNKVRAAAVLQLAELAIRPAPDAPLSEVPQKFFWQKKKATAKAKPIFTADHYPYFTRAATQLAISLPMEESAPVRAAMLKAVGVMTSFIKERRGDKEDKGNPVVADTERILSAWVNELAESNRTAKDKFISAFAEWSTVQKDWDKLKTLGEQFKALDERRQDTESTGAVLTKKDQDTWQRAKAKYEATESDVLRLTVAIAAFCDVTENTAVALQALMAEMATGGDETKFIVAQNIHRNKREAMTKENPSGGKTDTPLPTETDEQTKDKALRLPTLEVAAKTLTDTRDALAITLRTLPPVPDNFPARDLANAQKEIDAADIIIKARSSEQKRTDALKKTEAAIKVIKKLLSPSSQTRWQRSPALNLAQCFLAGADLGGATLTGANLHRASLIEADLNSATLTGANLGGAMLTAADLTGATLTRINFFAARLTEADLTGAILTGANLHRATLTEADLSYTTLTGANLHSATLMQADLSGATLTVTDFGSAILTDATVNGSTLDEAKNIPKTWDKADYIGFPDELDAKLRARVGAAYQKQQDELKEKGVIQKVKVNR